MKLRNLFELLGLRRAPARFGYRLGSFDVPGAGTVRYAQWLHPRERPKSIDAAVVAELRRYIRPGDFCIDVGAHTGDTTVPMGIAAGPEGLVLAVEPNPYVYPVLEKNARTNRDVMRIVPMLVAATPTPGSIEMEYSDHGFCNGGRHEGISPLRHGHSYKLLAQGLNLTDEVRADFAPELPRLRFIKTDAEGYDLYVLQSLAGLIDQQRPYVKAEVYKGTSADYRRGLLEFFTGRGYVVHRTRSDADLKGDILDAAGLADDRTYDIFAVPG